MHSSFLALAGSLGKFTSRFFQGLTQEYESAFDRIGDGFFSTLFSVRYFFSRQGWYNDIADAS